MRMGLNLISLKREERPLSPFWLLSILSIGFIGSSFLQYIFHGASFFRGQSAAIWFTFLFFGISIVLWFFTRRESALSTLGYSLLALLLMLWLISIGHDIAEGGGFNWTAFLTPLMLLMIWSKPPARHTSLRFADFYALTLIATMAVVHILSITGLHPYREEILTRWFPRIPGITNGFRWEGMFGDPNLGGYVGAFLLTYGLTRSGWKFWLISLFGLFPLVLSESRAAWLAAVLGVVLAALGRLLGKRQTAKVRRITILSGSIAVVIPFAIFLILDPTMNGRTPIWEASFKLLSKNPIFGIGNSGYSDAAVNGDIPWGNTDSHNLIIDSLVRNGIVAGLLALAVLVVISITVIRVFKIDKGQSTTIWFTFFVGTMTYSVVGWIYIGVQAMPLVISVLFAESAYLARSKSKESTKKFQVSENSVHLPG